MLANSYKVKWADSTAKFESRERSGSRPLSSDHLFDSLKQDHTFSRELPQLLRGCEPIANERGDNKKKEIKRYLSMLLLPFVGGPHKFF